MKKNYVAPSLEITKFETADVLTDGSALTGLGTIMEGTQYGQGQTGGLGSLNDPVDPT